MQKNIVFENRDKLRSIASKYGIEEIRLFGSYAENRQSENSDVDLLVAFEQGRKKWISYISFVHEVEDLLGTKVEVLTKESLNAHMRPYIESQAIDL